MMLYAGRPSSREKDLVDLVVLATTPTVRTCHRASRVGRGEFKAGPG
jgi:hypothetical protein